MPMTILTISRRHTSFGSVQTEPNPRAAAKPSFALLSLRSATHLLALSLTRPSLKMVRIWYYVSLGSKPMIIEVEPDIFVGSFLSAIYKHDKILFAKHNVALAELQLFAVRPTSFS